MNSDATATAAAASASDTLLLRAKATLMNGIGPQVVLRVDGKVVAATEVKAADYTDYAFHVGAVASGAHLDVDFINDANSGKQDRNLYVDSLVVNGATLKPTDAGVTYDRGTGNAAFDGYNVIAGRDKMSWAGALRFVVATGPVTTAPPAPTPAPPPPAPPAASSPVAFTFPDGSRRVWVHEMIQVPTFVPSTPFGANYPLTLRAKWESPKRPQDTPALFLGAGITGVQLLWGEGADVSGHFDEAMKDYDGTGLEIAPCLAVNTVAGGLAMIDTYLAIAKTHPSAAKITISGTDYYVISIYGTRYGKSAAFWSDFKNQSTQKGRKVYLLADAITAISFHGGKLEPTTVEPFAKDDQKAFLNVFDAAWTFDDGVDVDWTNLVNLRLTTTQRFAGGMLPAYNRESSYDGGYSDPEGTAKYRRQWSDALASGLTWNHVVSWNDVSERHDIWPTSEWSYTRSDITAFYSALMRKVAWPTALATPQLYATSAQRANVNGPAATAEAMVLNTSTSAVTVQAQLVDGNGAAYGKPVAQTVAAATSGSATIRQVIATMPAGHFLRLKATSFSSSGAKLQEVLSAPILVYATGEQTKSYTDTRVKYNSVAARMALSDKVQISISGTPASGIATATVTAPKGATVRFADVLQNTYLADSRMDPSGPQAAKIPLVNGISNMSGVTVNTLASGFYLGRVIDSNEKVGYSDPVYVPAP